ncbi:hypothetical protein DENSPDRAFT_689411 [Dentipellis sp. KUC8613]|nr:hypothetical protein DENSPDRAFT_689411 [Dentipellis sp. KUC8613]
MRSRAAGTEGLSGGGMWPRKRILGSCARLATYVEDISGAIREVNHCRSRSCKASRTDDGRDLHLRRRQERPARSSDQATSSRTTNYSSPQRAPYPQLKAPTSRSGQPLHVQHYASHLRWHPRTGQVPPLARAFARAILRVPIPHAICSRPVCRMVGADATTDVACAAPTELDHRFAGAYDHRVWS